MTNDITANLRYNLKTLRKSRNITQEEIANFLQVDRSTYSYYEIGKTIPKIYTIKKIADFYNISLDSLLFNKVS